MTFNNSWQALVSKSPKLNDGNSIVEIKASQLERLLRQFYDAGAKEQKGNVDVQDFLRRAAGL